MVNGWLKSSIPTWTTADARCRQQNERIFATKTALTSKGQRRPGQSEVVLDQAILGLLINDGSVRCGESTE
jgi:hypothetical protein